MGITIKTKDGKLILSLCTKAGNFPYNKGGYIAQVEADKVVDQYAYKGAKLLILRPVIDKLIFDYHAKDCGSHKRSVQEKILKNASALLDNKAIPFKTATYETVGYQRLKNLWKSHQHTYVLTYEPTDAKIIVQLGVKKKGVGFLRCELNPARLRAGGMAFFRDFVKKLVSNEFKDISFDTIAKIPKSIRRIDIAVDMLGVDASDLEGEYIYKGKKLKKQVVQNPTGRLETHYFRKPENDKNEAYWYNKRQWFKDEAKNPIDGGQQSPYGKALYTRFEYRIYETDKPIANLKSMLNHLKKVHFRAVDYSRVKEKDYTHALFLRYALHRTRDKALEMIPDEMKAEYGASYDKAIVDIWKPEKIWNDGWHKELISLGLLAPEILKKKKSTKKAEIKKTSG